MTPPADDRALVALLIQRRDPGAFDALYDRHTPALYGLALRLLGGDEHSAQDVVHDVWLRAVPRLAEFRWESALRTWLSGFVINAVRGAARRAEREADLVDEAGPPVADERLRGVFHRIDLERALAGLAPGFRHVLVLHDIEGYTHDEIAAMLGIVAGTSKSQLARARAAMRRALEPAEGA